MNKYSNESNLARGFGILLAFGFTVFVVVMLTGCISFGGGPNQPMLERGQEICKDTNGEWIDNRCVYPAWQLADTTTSVLGVEV